MKTADFRLTTDDRRALAEMARAEGGRRWMSVLFVVACTLAPAMPWFTGAVDLMPSLWVLSALLVPICAVTAVFCVKVVILRGGGSPSRVLASAQPSGAVGGTMTDSGADVPFPWSLEFDVPEESKRFAYFGRDDPEWLFRSGARFIVWFFRADYPFHGVVAIECADSGRRYWMEFPRVGSSLAYDMGD